MNRFDSFRKMLVTEKIAVEPTAYHLAKLFTYIFYNGRLSEAEKLRWKSLKLLDGTGKVLCSKADLKSLLWWALQGLVWEGKIDRIRWRESDKQ